LCGQESSTTHLKRTPCHSPGPAPPDLLQVQSQVLDVINTVMEAQIGPNAKQGASQALPHAAGVAFHSGRARLLECCLGILANIGKGEKERL